MVTPETRVEEMVEELFEVGMTEDIGEPKRSPQRALQTKQLPRWGRGAHPVPRGSLKLSAELNVIHAVYYSRIYANLWLRVILN